MKLVTGECLCHGVVVTVTYGCPARPEPYTRGTDPFGGGPRVKVVLGVDPDVKGGFGGSHEVPLSWPKGVERLTNQPTTVKEDGMHEKGDRVELDGTTDMYTRLQPGARGTVRYVDAFGTVHIDWDDGSKLGLIPGEDRWHTVREPSTGA